MRVHAIRDIEAEEELTISYIGEVTHVRTQRQAKLILWGFDCTCPVCEDMPHGRRREEKRTQL